MEIIEEPIGSVPIEIPGNRPVDEYVQGDWGKSMVDSVQPANEWGEGSVTVKSVRYDPVTAERIPDHIEIWTLSQLREQKAMLEKELAKVTQQLALAESAIAQETERQVLAAQALAAEEEATRARLAAEQAAKDAEASV